MSKAIIKYGNNAVGIGGSPLALNNLVPENVKSGVIIGGVVGTAPGPDTDLLAYLEGDTNVLKSNYLTKIRDYAFNMIPSSSSWTGSGQCPFTKIDLPNCENIGVASCRYCKNLEELNLPKCKTIGANAFEKSKIHILNIPEIETIGNTAFYSTSSSMTSFSPIALNLPKCTSIGNSAFAQSTSGYRIPISSIILPLCTYIGDQAFDEGTNSSASYHWLVSISLPEIETIRPYVFRGCRKLNNVDLPKVIKLMEYCFTQCVALTNLTLRANQVCTLDNTNSLPASSSQHMTIYVPSALIEDYKVANNWSTLYNNGYITFSTIT